MTRFNKVVDSGKRQEFNTGSRRDTQEGKGRFDLLPPILLIRLAKHYENGAAKYGDHNWRKGQPLSRYYSSALRHMTKWMLGWKDEDHLAAAIWNLTSIMEHEVMIERGKLPKELDDRYPDLLDDYEFEKTALPDNTSVPDKESALTVELKPEDLAVLLEEADRMPRVKYEGPKPIAAPYHHFGAIEPEADENQRIEWQERLSGLSDITGMPLRNNY